ncbi:MAG: hypothetical protein CMJ45_00145 [Planctomyces sp.]|jgi:hypothetical protein|nr:hypothetical protein [Planctomyces sp.]
MSSADERLYQAVRRKDVDSASKALQNGASANYVHIDKKSTYTDCFPVLYAACQEKNKELVELLLAHGADPNAEFDQSAVWGSEHEPCLFAALNPQRPSADIVRVLLKGGADPNLPRVWREEWSHEVSATYVAGIRRNGEELLALLREYGARG